MPRVRDVLEAAPAIGNLLVLGEGIRDQRKVTEVLLEHLGKRRGRSPAPFLLWVLKQIERQFDRKVFAIHVETERRDRLVEETVPGADPRHRFFVEQLLDAILKLVGLLFAHVLDPRTIAAEFPLSERPLDK